MLLHIGTGDWLLLLRIDGLLLLLQSILQQYLAEIAAYAFFAVVVCTAVMYVNMRTRSDLSVTCPYVILASAYFCLSQLNLQQQL